ncbi:hypothetical protein ABZR88_19345 [Mucilaginibacter yixingensis]|nr:hypothetical protein [Mucilaginibacter yixingensis]
MKIGKLILCPLFLLLIVSLQVAYSQPAASRARVYELLKAGDADAITAELGTLKDSQWKQKEGYQGALLMKKAGLLKKAKEKLNTFKEGRIKLETAIANNAGDAELHFLRLIIEENAPKVVKYKADLAADAAIIIKHHKEMPAAAQEALADYVKTSKILHPSDL